MNVKREDIIQLLHDGTKDQMEGLKCPNCGSAISYRYSEEYGNFGASCDCLIERTRGFGYKPNCATFFGDVHTF